MIQLSDFFKPWISWSKNGAYRTYPYFLKQESGFKHIIVFFIKFENLTLRSFLFEWRKIDFL